MLQFSTRAALALGLVCAAAACSREDEADKQVLLTDSAAASALAPVATELAVWDVSFDDGAADPGYQLTEQPGGGWAVKSGSAGVSWRDRDLVAGGPFQVRATIAAHSGSSGGYGIFVGGRHLQDPDRAYTAFLIRGDGQFRIERREAGSSPTYVDWTPSTAIQPVPHGAEPGQNTLEIRTEAMATHFLVNGTEVKALPTDQAQPYGTAGLRLEKGADVSVTSFDMQGQGSGDTAGPPVLRNPPDTHPSLPPR